jgi:hypothetical protein
MWADWNVDQLGEGVWWAGVEAAPVWLDVARDYSEDWIHQQQIRDAVRRPGLSSPEFFDPLLDTLMRALPKMSLCTPKMARLWWSYSATGTAR